MNGFLQTKNVKAIVIACGTATSQALEEMKKEYDIPIIGIINSTTEYIKRNKELRKIGVIATTGTIRSKGWQSKIHHEIPDAIISYKACPLLAPMAEEGWTENEIAKLTIQEYLKGFEDIDCLILGCTHYPLFKKVIREEIGGKVEIINTGEKLSKDLEEILKKEQKENRGTEQGDYEIYLTDTETNFLHVASKLLKEKDIKEKITMIKMDIEGCEQKALKGAEKHIKEETPKMMISVYHGFNDLIEIYSYLKELNPKYKFFLRYYGGPIFPTEIVLYAI